MLVFIQRANLLSKHNGITSSAYSIPYAGYCLLMVTKLFIFDFKIEHFDDGFDREIAYVPS